MTGDRGLIPVWFFIGVLLVFYGVLIAATGIYELSNPPESPVALSDLHAPVWWGAVLTLIGAFYTISFRPGKRR